MNRLKIRWKNKCIKYIIHSWYYWNPKTEFYKLKWPYFYIFIDSKLSSVKFWENSVCNVGYKA